MKSFIQIEENDQIIASIVIHNISNEYASSIISNLLKDRDDTNVLMDILNAFLKIDKRSEISNEIPKKGNWIYTISYKRDIDKYNFYIKTEHYDINLKNNYLSIDTPHSLLAMVSEKLKEK